MDTMDSGNIKKEISYILEFDKFFTYQAIIGNIIRKSSSASIKTRKQGNAIYTSRVPSHNKDTHRTILSLYNKSIALAPTESEELAVGYSNRSALLLHLCKYKECIADIERALQLANSKEIEMKLAMRRQSCLNLIYNVVSEETSPKPLPKLETSEKFPCASKSVSLQYSEKYGRHLVANEDIKPGELLIIEESYSHPDENQIYLICSHCMAYAWNGIPCNNCALVIYCSEKCKNDAWHQYHDIECSTLPYFFLFYSKNYNDVKLSTILLTSRLFIRTVKKEGLLGILNHAKHIENGKDMQINGFLSNGIFDNNKFSSFYNLARSTEDTEENSKLLGSLIIYVLLRYTNILKIDISKANDGMTYESLLISLRNIIINIKNIIQLNAYSFQCSACNCYKPIECLNTCDSTRGICVALFCSLINHSCKPNLSRMFLPGNKVVFFTVSSIKKGDKLCDTYGPCSLSVDKMTRTMHLKEKFNFICDCEACLQDWPETAMYPQGQDGKIYKQLKLKTNSVVNSIRILKIFADGNLDNMSYEGDLFQTAVKMSQMVHKYFTGFKAYSYALKFEEYIDLAITKLYSERNDILDSC